MKTSGFGIDPLKYDYYEVKDSLMPEKDIIKADLTSHLMQTLWLKPLNGELINVSVTGEVASGKSLVAEELFLQVNQNLKRQKKLPQPFDYFKHVVADQTEFLRLINADEKNVCILIDEYNTLSETGLNSTTEDKWYMQWSNVFAQMYWHRISTSPSHITDSNATIWLDVISADKAAKITRCRVRYHNIAEHQALTIGHADIDVKAALASDWHTRYREKKFARMDLLQVHGVRDIRDLEFAGITLAAYNQLKDAKGKVKTFPHVIRSEIYDQVRKKRLVYSLIAINDLIGRTKGILDLDYEIENQEAKAKKAGKTGAGEYQSGIQTIKELRDRALGNEKKLCEIHKKYQAI